MGSPSARSAAAVVTLTLLCISAAATAQTTGLIRGSVLSRAGQPLPDATVALVSLSGDSVREEARTDQQGHFRLEGVPPGQYSVAADRVDVGGQIFRVLVQPGGTVEVAFVLELGDTAAPWLRGLRDDQASAAAFDAGVRANRDGDYEEAIAQFEAALQLLPSCVDCHFNIGIALGQLERFNEAADAFSRALEVNPDYAAAYYGLADVYGRQGRADLVAETRGAANRIAMAALAADQALAREAMTRGIAFLESRNLTDAVAQLRLAVSTDTTLNEAHYWLGRSYEEQMELDAAAQSLRRYLAGAADGEHADDARRRLDRGR